MSEGRALDFMRSPGADIRDAGALDISAMRAELNENLFLFTWLIFGYTDMTPGFHLPICRFLERWGTPGWRRLGIEVPRETFKTSLCTRANSLWQVCRSEGYNATVAIFNAKEDNSKKWLRAIREVAETSKVFHALYGDMLPPGIGDDQPLPKRWKWNDDQIQFVRTQMGIPEASISALGIGGAATGGHWTHIIKDDIIGLEESLSEASMQRAREWCDTARFLERPAEKGCDLFVYTRWHYNDVYRYVREKWHDEYIIYHRGALELDELGNESSTFPEKWTTEELQRIRERDPYTFASQMMSDPKAGKDQSFQEGWVRFSEPRVPQGTTREHIVIAGESYDAHCHRLDDLEAEAPRSVALASLDKALLWDPAPSELNDRNRDRNARNGMVVVGRDAWDRDHVLAAVGTRLDPLDTMRLCIELALEWGVEKVAIEAVNFSKTYRHWAGYLLEREYPGKHVAFLPQKEERRSKDARILGLIPDLRDGLVYFNRARCQSLLQELREYPYGTTRDLLDALAMRNDVLSRPLTTGEVMRQEYERRHRVEAGSRYRGPRDSVNWTH